jgi:hypothetical protein
MKLTRFVVTASLPGVVVGLLVGSANLIMGFRDNPHGVYFNPLTGGVDWSFAAQMFLFYFTLTFAAVSVVVAIGLAVFAAFRALVACLRHKKS